MNGLQASHFEYAEPHSFATTQQGEDEHAHYSIRCRERGAKSILQMMAVMQK